MSLSRRNICAIIYMPRTHRRKPTKDDAPPPTTPPPEELVEPEESEEAQPTIEETLDALLASATTAVQVELTEADNAVQKAHLVREKLIQLSESGDIPQKIGAIKKASTETLEKINRIYETKVASRSNKYAAEVIIGRYAALMKQMGIVRSKEKLEEDLRQDALLERDIVSMMEFLTPYIPYTGLLFGTITTAHHAYDHQTSPLEEPLPTPPPEPPSDIMR